MISIPPKTPPKLLSAKRLTFALAVAIAYGVAAAAALSALATEHGHTIDVSRVFDAGPLPGAAPEIVIAPIPADPPPMVERSQWVFDLRWDRGDIWLLGVQPLELPAPRETPRMMGRFALELFEGTALIERTRFDFPMLAGADVGDAGRSSHSLTQNLRTRIGVIFPAAGRGTRLELWDRATNRRWALPWPPSPAANTMADGGR